MNHSISARRAGLLDVNDGRPFAWVSRSHLRDLNGTDRFILASAYCTARAQDSTSGQEAGYVTTPAKGWGPWLGLSERTARDSFTRLCHADLLTRCDWGKRLATWELNSTALALRDDGELDLRIELAPMTRPRWTCAMRSAWISLCGFVRVEQGELSCFPKQALIAVGAGVTLRNVQRALYRIESDRCLAITRRRGSALYLLHPIGDAPDTGKNRRINTGKNRHITPARIDVHTGKNRHITPARIDVPELESLTGDLELEDLSRDQYPRSRPKPGANADVPIGTWTAKHRAEQQAELDRETANVKRRKRLAYTGKRQVGQSTEGESDEQLQGPSVADAEDRRRSARV